MTAGYPQALVDGHLDYDTLRKLPAADRMAVGRVIFQYHCNDCHAAGVGYSAVAPLLRGRSRAMMLDMIQELNTAHYFMPPWAGNAAEAELLADYLWSITPRLPAGMEPVPGDGAVTREQKGISAGR